MPPAPQVVGPSPSPPSASPESQAAPPLSTTIPEPVTAQPPSMPAAADMSQANRRQVQEALVVSTITAAEWTAFLGHGRTPRSAASSARSAPTRQIRSHRTRPPSWSALHDLLALIRSRTHYSDSIKDQQAEGLFPGETGQMRSHHRVSIGCYGPGAAPAIAAPLPPPPRGQNPLPAFNPFQPSTSVPASLPGQDRESCLQQTSREQ
jgi:hypothetical protein